ncbi:MAG: hypothetical protein QXZ09_03490 [Candidatus Methanomethylicaceae archaeon]
MAIERDPVRVATGGLAGLLGTTFSPIPPTPADEQRRAAAAPTSAANGGQIVNIPSFKPTGVTNLPSPLLIRPETVSRRYFRGRPEEAFGPGSKLDEVLDRIGQIIQEQVYQSIQDESSVTSPSGEAPIVPTPAAAPRATTQQQKPVIEPAADIGALPPIVLALQPFVPPPPPPHQYSQTWGGVVGEVQAAPELSSPSPSGPSPTGPSYLTLGASLSRNRLLG